MGLIMVFVILRTSVGIASVRLLIVLSAVIVVVLVKNLIMVVVMSWVSRLGMVVVVSRSLLWKWVVN